jgi:hypothetical protein
MKILERRWTIPVAIAAITTIATPSFTQYLLTQPWCIEIHTNNMHRVLYGVSNCLIQLEGIHPHSVNQKTNSSVVITNRRAIWSSH